MKIILKYYNIREDTSRNSTKYIRDIMRNHIALAFLNVLKIVMETNTLIQYILIFIWINMVFLYAKITDRNIL